MKRLIIAIILVLNASAGFSQEDAIVPLPQVGIYEEDDNKYYYYKDIAGDLNKFLGVWKYQTQTKELIVTFYLNVHRESGGNYYDEIYAKFKYTENGTVIYNTLSLNNPANEKVIFGSSLDNQNTNLIALSYNEPTDIDYGRRYNNARLNIEYLGCGTPGCSPQLNWNILWEKELETDPWPFKIPSDIVLTKQ